MHKTKYRYCGPSTLLVPCLSTFIYHISFLLLLTLVDKRDNRCCSLSECTMPGLGRQFLLLLILWLRNWEGLAWPVYCLSLLSDVSCSCCHSKAYLGWTSKRAHSVSELTLVVGCLEAQLGLTVNQRLPDCSSMADFSHGIWLPSE